MFSVGETKSSHTISSSDRLLVHQASEMNCLEMALLDLLSTEILESKSLSSLADPQ